MDQSTGPQELPEGLPRMAPNPGSEAAIDAGCLCPVLDNRHGKGYYAGPDGVFIYNQGCPIHWVEEPDG